MHPASLASRSHDPRAAKIGQVARDFRLADAEDLDEVANADFAVRDKVKQAQARGIGQGAEEKIERERFLFFRHVTIIYALTDMIKARSMRIYAKTHILFAL